MKTNDLADTRIKKSKIVLSSGYRQCYLALSFLSAVHLITHQTICAVHTEPLFSFLRFYSASKLHTYKKIEQPEGNWVLMLEMMNEKKLIFWQPDHCERTPGSHLMWAVKTEKK